MTTTDEYVYSPGAGKNIRVTAIDAPTPARRKFRADFVKVPRAWIERLRDAPGSVYGLALDILAEDFRRKNVGGEIILSAAVTGLPQRQRHRAIAALVSRGLIEVRKGRNQAPRVVRLIQTEMDG